MKQALKKELYFWLGTAAVVLAALMLVFTFAQSMYLVRHMPPAKPKDDKADAGVSQ